MKAARVLRRDPRTKGKNPMSKWLLIFLVAMAGSAQAQNPWDLAKKAVGGSAAKEAEKRVNAQLLSESRKNQCSFKTDTAELAPGCDQRLRQLANGLIEAKKQLNS